MKGSIVAREVKWYIENRILTVTHSGVFTANDAVDLIAECMTYFEGANHPIHVIVNHSETESLTADLHHITKIRELATPFFTHPNLGMMIAYGIENRLIRFFATMAGQLSKHEYRLVDTFDEAIEIIKRNDLNIAEDLSS